MSARVDLDFKPSTARLVQFDPGKVTILIASIGSFINVNLIENVHYAFLSSVVSISHLTEICPLNSGLNLTLASIEELLE